MAFILLAMIIALSFLNPRFFTVSNFLTIMRQVAINGALAAGMTMVILTGGIDLSVGGTVALAGCLAAGALQSAPHCQDTVRENDPNSSSFHQAAGLHACCWRKV